MWFGTSKDTKTIHVEMEKQMFGNFWAIFNNGTQRDLEQTGFARFLSVYHTLVHITLQLPVIISSFLKQALYQNAF